jgi:DNA modification methylase
MKLTDNEKREVVKLIEADKPLPDKYRFLIFDEKREVELVWNGKTNEVTNIVLPFQIIEHVDEPRSDESEKKRFPLFEAAGISIDSRGRQLKGWTNKLIWGDNKLILSSLKNGPIREEIEKQGGIKLIYIDPPFDVGADFSMDLEIGDDIFTKKPNVLEELAYRDTWGNGADSFIAMIYERIVIMRDLLAEDGSIYVHCDWHANHFIRCILNEVFGSDNFINEIIWYYYNKLHDSRKHLLPRAHDSIFRYAKIEGSQIHNPLKEDRDKPVTKLKYHKVNGQIQNIIGADGKAVTYTSTNKTIDDVWRIRCLQPANKKEWLNYDTQKPEDFIERIINMSTNNGDLVADFFCGSGTTAAAAEKLGRKWIVSDLGKFAIHTTRKRMIGVQRQLKSDGKDFRAFEILNLGKYERAHYIGINVGLREEEKQLQLAQKEKNYISLILHAYRAETVENFKCFHGKKAGRMVSVGPINLPVTRLFVEEVILECREKRISRVDILAFEFEMGLFPNIQEEAKAKGIDLAMKYIPREVFDKRAVEKNQVVFHDVSYIEVKPHVKKGALAVELTDYSVYYSQDSIDTAAANLKNGSNKIVVENGKIIKVVKDKNGIVTKEVLTKKWTDWVDYWSVDFHFESKREIVRVKNEATSEFEEVWTGDFIFENEWQSFRTKKDRTLELKSAWHECKPGRYKIAVKVVDIFGNDTMKIFDMRV